MRRVAVRERADRGGDIADVAVVALTTSWRDVPKSA